MAKLKDYSPFKKKMDELKRQITVIRDNTVTKVSNEITTSINHYSSKTWDNHLEKILDLIYKGLIEVYSNTKQVLRNTYHKLPENRDIKNIGDLLYNKDGLTLDERCKNYWDIAKVKLQSNESNQAELQQLKITLINQFYKIINTEMNFVKSNVKRINKPLNASMLIIEAGECDGQDHPACVGGEYPADELVDLPPYHPNCDCDYYWEVTDDLDDKEDLDLENEE